MAKGFDGNAIVYCEGAYNTPNGKTAHGLVRFTDRYHVVAVIDSRYGGKDAGEVLDGKVNQIPIFSSLEEAIKHLNTKGIHLDNFVIGLAPDGGRLPASARQVVIKALKTGMNVDSGLHDFLSEDPDIAHAASEYGRRIRDVRKTLSRKDLHFFSGEIENVNCLKIAILGTDSAIGKRTTAWLLVRGLWEDGIKVEMIGTGQTAWMQGAKYSLIMDSLINDFVSGEIEHAVISAWKEEKPEFIIVEGQGSLMNPAYPGGFEIMAAARPEYVIMQHAPTRKEYDGFPGYILHSLKEQIAAVEMISGKKVMAITVNHEGMKDEEILPACEKIKEETGLPAFDVLKYGTEELIKLVKAKNHEWQQTKGNQGFR